MSTGLVIKSWDGADVVDSRVIAEHCQVQHQSLFELLKDYQGTFEREFSPIRFETGIGEKLPQGGFGKAPRFALLTEDQASFLITLTRNTDPVIQFKATLVKAFSEARRQLSTVKVPQSLPEALRAYANAVEAKELLAIENTKLAVDVERMQPKEDFFDCAMTSKDSMLVRDAAKLLNPDVPGGIGEKRLFAWMHANGWLFGANRPYQTKIDSGYLVQTERPIPTVTHGTIIKYTPRVTQRGLVALRKALTKPTP